MHSERRGFSCVDNLYCSGWKRLCSCNPIVTVVSTLQCKAQREEEKNSHCCCKLHCNILVKAPLAISSRSKHSCRPSWLVLWSVAWLLDYPEFFPIIKRDVKNSFSLKHWVQRGVFEELLSQTMLAFLRRGRKQRNIDDSSEEGHLRMSVKS